VLDNHPGTQRHGSGGQIPAIGTNVDMLSVLIVWPPCWQCTHRWRLYNTGQDDIAGSPVTALIPYIDVQLSMLSQKNA
jgi:hypothetical protein